MSQDLKNSVLSLISDSGIMEIEDGPGIEAYKDLQINDTTNEQKQVRLYHKLIELLDKLMVQEEKVGEFGYEEVKKELIQSEKLALLVKEGEIPNDDELLRFLKQVQYIRRMVVDSGIGVKLEERDDLIDDIIALENEVSARQSKLNKLNQEINLKFEKSKELTSKLIEKHKNQISNNGIDNTKLKIQLQEKLKIAKNKSYNLSEEIQAFLVENGINWAKDKKLRELVLYCGDIYE
ncbi:hypothetical protein BN7_1630 [Wickerhamomyces ciferrii]|uniref:Centromere protein H C-terminal domain-containing protein n=1 Tax=Wickerhamomyces ciferrii (strain ATCC 14091 / BCRC 22168 / CBS 111 / JCM 3599 / NBRC 0793 / NRRL Y-1031 F-60-10) TaxID=1206466 RepID=K0KLT4_WICCF|nr:uncharacterized protein BN7_1630 [Wickerhamomyces ciferrii]CCH42088.1 hypothetical protein BN7_1630 [Wickerhamomyces ciferrii]